jgi:hypothetical protein
MMFLQGITAATIGSFMISTVDIISQGCLTQGSEGLLADIQDPHDDCLAKNVTHLLNDYDCFVNVSSSLLMFGCFSLLAVFLSCLVFSCPRHITIVLSSTGYPCMDISMKIDARS